MNLENKYCGDPREGGLVLQTAEEQGGENVVTENGVDLQV